ncbi:class I SAM-dependent methyltransferase [Kutzneria sp. CA-103260]|uniref:class I SAM-dependent methyltransferase n=1 Tax=Kutzneria sp. CA-103260 TaxID=2802641 RepID=UPI001BA9CE47|nr:class I SAM-dependent methyltransferase [Kutzneria sp. CA-103260]
MTSSAQVRPDGASFEDNTLFGNVQPLVDTALLPAGDGQPRVVRAAHRLYEHLISLWAPGAIEAAFDLGVFDELAKGPATADELAKSLSTNAKATRVLLDGLNAYDLLVRTWDADGTVVYVLPDEVRDVLRPDGLFSLAGKIGYDRQMAWGAWRNLAETVRTGALADDGSQQHNQISASEYESLVRGINFWAPPVVHALSAQLKEHGWAGDKTAGMLDVGCGTGIYSQLLLQQFAGLTATGLDVERILPLAIAQSEQLDVADRFHPLRRDFWREDWGTGFDLVLFVNIFHLQTPEDARDLAIKANKALADGGLVAIVDQIVVEDEVQQNSTQNRFFRLFAASMMATGGGDAYTLDQYDEWLTGAGLRRVALIDTPMHRILLAGRD